MTTCSRARAVGGHCAISLASALPIRIASSFFCGCGAHGIDSSDTSMNFLHVYAPATAVYRAAVAGMFIVVPRFDSRCVAGDNGLFEGAAPRRALVDSCRALRQLRALVVVAVSGYLLAALTALAALAALIAALAVCSTTAAPPTTADSAIAAVAAAAGAPAAAAGSCSHGVCRVCVCSMPTHFTVRCRCGRKMKCHDVSVCVTVSVYVQPTCACGDAALHTWSLRMCNEHDGYSNM